MPQTSWHLRKIFISGAPKGTKGAAAAAATGTGAIADFVLRKLTIWGITDPFANWNILMFISQTSSHRRTQTQTNNFKSFNEDIYAHFDYGQLS